MFYALAKPPETLIHHKLYENRNVITLFLFPGHTQPCVPESNVFFITGSRKNTCGNTETPKTVRTVVNPLGRGQKSFNLNICNKGMVKLFFLS